MSERIMLPEIDDDAPTMPMSRDAINEAIAICGEAETRAKRTASSAKMKAAKR